MLNESHNAFCTSQFNSEVKANQNHSSWERAPKLASAFVIKDHGFVTVSLDDNTSNLKQFIIHNKPRQEKFLELVYVIFEALSVVFRPRRRIHEIF